MDVAREPVAGFFRRVFDSVDAHVDDHDSRLYHIAGNEFWTPDGSDQNVGLPRQRARFLCGITSPATTRAKLRSYLARKVREGAVAELLENQAA